MNYNIIKDEKLLKEFIGWLPELLPHEQYYLCLFARSKYCKDITHIKSDKSQLKRFTSIKDRMFDKIKQLECPVGSYRQYKQDKESIEIPQEALALYITPNPRDLWRATMNTMVKMAKCIQDTNTLSNPQAEAMSEIQKSKGKTRVVTFDFDVDESEIPRIQKQVLAQINEQAVKWLRTRGGMHVIIDPMQIAAGVRKSWYQSICLIDGKDQTGDNMIPVVGCTQGEFIPHFINTINHESVPVKNVLS